MDLKALLLHHADELGLPEEVGLQLHAMLGPLSSSLGEVMDLGIYFHSVTRCEAECIHHSLPAECGVLLWSVCASLRDPIEGSISLDRLVMQREVKVPVIPASPFVESLPLFGGEMNRSVAPGAVMRLKRALACQQRACLQMKKVVVKEGATLRAKEVALRAKITKDCLDLLVRLGSSSPRYSLLYADGTREPSAKEKEYVCKLFFQSQGRVVQCAAANNYRREFSRFLEWLTSLVLPLVSCSSFHVASWLCDMSGRGVSIPSLCYASLVWASGVFEIELWINDVGVRLEGKGPRDRPPPKPATCPSIALVIKMELLVLDETKSDVTRIYAGKCCAETHGSLRFRDLQMSLDLKDAPDALLGRAFMKKQGWRSWAALKVGFSGLDWGTPFLALLQKHNMPGDDFVLKRPTPTMSGFQDRPASFSDALHATRFIMVKELGMTPEEACCYSEHGWRHVIITAGRQLKNPLTRDQQNEVGHWVENSAMPKVYDAVASSVELQAKARVIEAFQGGRRLLEPGELGDPNVNVGGLPVIEELSESVHDKECLVPHCHWCCKPMGAYDSYRCRICTKYPYHLHCLADHMQRHYHPQYPPRGDERSSSSSHASPEEEGETKVFGCLPIEDAPKEIEDLVLASPCKKAKMPDPVRVPVVDDVKQVYNALKGRLHLVCPRVVDPQKADYTVCLKWRCGSVEAPSRNAEFYDRFDTIALCSSSFNVQFQPCGSCFDARILRKYGWEDVIPDKDALMPSLLASDDEVSSVSSSDSSLED